MAVRFRPHHFLCSVGFAGYGYNDAFTANMTNVVSRGLRARGGGKTSMLVTDEADAICAPCPRRDGLGCLDDPMIERLDRAHAAALGIAPGDILTWGEAVERIRQNVMPDDLDRLCEGCRWLASGICKVGLAQLLAETQDRSEPAR